MIAQLIRPNGLVTDVMPRNGADFKLDELCKLVECEYIDIVGLPDDLIMIVDDDGRSKNLPVNKIATRLYSKDRISIAEILALLETQLIVKGYNDFKVMAFGGEEDFDTVVGNALVCDKSMVR